MTKRLPQLLIAVSLVAALVLAAPLAAEASTLAGHEQAGIAKKKKCGKAKKKSKSSVDAAKKKKCSKKKKGKGQGKGNSGVGGGGQAKTDPAAQFRAALAGARLERVYSSSNLSSSGSERYNLCSDGSFSYHGESSTNYTFSTTDAQGTWQVVSAQFNAQGTAAQGVISYTSNNSSFPAGQAEITLVGANQAYLGQTEFQRTAGGAGC